MHAVVCVLLHGSGDSRYLPVLHLLLVALWPCSAALVDCDDAPLPRKGKKEESPDHHPIHVPSARSCADSTECLATTLEDEAQAQAQAEAEAEEAAEALLVLSHKRTLHVPPRIPPAVAKLLVEQLPAPSVAFPEATHDERRLLSKLADSVAERAAILKPHIRKWFPRKNEHQLKAKQQTVMRVQKLYKQVEPAPLEAPDSPGLRRKRCEMVAASCHQQAQNFTAMCRQEAVSGCNVEEFIQESFDMWSLGFMNVERAAYECYTRLGQCAGSPQPPAPKGEKNIEASVQEYLQLAHSSAWRRNKS